MAARSNPPAAFAALALIQLAVGYEWLVSGLSKLANGNFPSGLAGTLRELEGNAPGWYGGFLRSVVLPHAQTWGWTIELTELATGAALAVAALAFLRGRGVRAARAATVAASAVGAALLVNFELANGGGFGLHLASDSFNEGVDLDTLLLGVQLVLLAFALRGLRPVRRTATA